MNKTYTVLSGSFIQPDGSTVGVGGEITLADDQAQVHRQRLRLKPEPAKVPATAAPKLKAPDAKGND
ncbi:MAG: hypothetical protein JKY26_17460 [Pseudomonas sp.]|nr:hypothetical protein [Pseudomonas sp.]